MTLKNVNSSENNVCRQMFYEISLFFLGEIFETHARLSDIGCDVLWDGVTPLNSSSRWYRRKRWRCVEWPESWGWAPCTHCSPPEQSEQWRVDCRMIPEDPTERWCLKNRWITRPFPQRPPKTLTPSHNHTNRKNRMKLHSRSPSWASQLGIQFNSQLSVENFHSIHD